MASKKEMEGNLKKMRMEDDLKKNKKMEDDLKKKWKMNQSTKINLIGCDTILNSPSKHLFSLLIIHQFDATLNVIIIPSQ